MDHDRVSIHTTGMSCGVLLLSNMTADIRGILYQVATRLYHPSRGDPAAIIVWSDVMPDEGFPYHPLSMLIQESGFGDIVESVPAENPKTGNCIAMWVWTIDHQVFKEWYRDERLRRIGKVGT